MRRIVKYAMIKSRFHSFALFLIYFTVNFLFLTKYGVRQSVVPLSLLTAIFVGFHVFFFFSKDFLLKKYLRPIYVNLSVILISLIYLIFCQLLDNPVELNIDRWQTLDFSLDYWLQGIYIYDFKNFMGNYSSYLPGQLLLALPFYLLGNVGYLQIGAFLIFCFAIAKQFESNVIKTIGIGMFGISLSFIYEVLCKSDFIASFIIVASFIALWHHVFHKNYFKKPILLGICVGILFLTRSVVAIALIIFLLRAFFETDRISRIKTIIGFSLTVVLLTLSVILPAKDFNYILKYNPVLLQSQSNNTLLMLVFIITACILSFFVQKIADVFYFSGYVIFFLMLSFLIEQYWLYDYNYQNNFFSTTYLASCLPFIIFGFCYTLKKNENKYLV